MTSPVKIGIVGPGLVFWKHHYPALLRMSGRFEITAILFHRQKPNLPRELENVLCTNDEEVFFGNGDFCAVDICTPIACHKEWILKSLEKGKRVFVEKPAVGSVKEIIELTNLPRAQKDMVFVGENYRFIPSILKIKEIISKHNSPPLFVELSNFQNYDSQNSYARTSWRKYPEHDGGILLDGGVHLISVARWLLGDIKSRSKTLTSISNQFGRYDTCIATFDSQSGTQGVLKLSFGLVDSDPAIIRLYLRNRTLVATKTTLTEMINKERVLHQFLDGEDFEGEFRDFYEVAIGEMPPPYGLDEALADTQTALNFFTE